MSPTECGVSECDSEAPQREAMTQNRAGGPQKKKSEFGGQIELRLERL